MKGARLSLIRIAVLIALVRRRRIRIALRVEDSSKREQRIDGIGIVVRWWAVGGRKVAPSVILGEIAPRRIVDCVGLVLPHGLAVCPLWLHVRLRIRLTVWIYRRDVGRIDGRDIILLAPSVAISVVSPHTASIARHSQHYFPCCLALIVQLNDLYISHNLPCCPLEFLYLATFSIPSPTRSSLKVS